MTLCFALGVVVGAWLDWDMVRSCVYSVYKSTCSRKRVHLAKKYDDIPPPPAYEFAPAPVHLQEENEKVMQAFCKPLGEEEEEDSSDDE